MKRLLYIFMQLLLLTACSDDEQAGKDEKVYPDITVITPLGGMGDNGYNDSALSGLLETASEAGLLVSIQRPKNMEQAADCVRKWCDARQGMPRLLVLSDNEYSGLAKSLQTDEQNSVLLFEHDGKDLPSGIATFRISRYGVSYLSGCLAQGSEVARVIGGRKGDPAVEEATKAFGEGYTAHNPQGEVIKHYLANDHTGWAMPDSAYRLAAKHNGDFFFPLAKGANAGIFKYSRETPFVFMLIAGMDVDCSLYSKRVPFSVVIDVKSAVKEHILRWIDGGRLSGHTSYGITDKKASVLLSTLFYEVNDIWEEYYVEPSYWENIYDQNYEVAIKKEKAYEMEFQ